MNNKEFTGLPSGSLDVKASELGPNVLLFLVTVILETGSSSCIGLFPCHHFHPRSKLKAPVGILWKIRI